MANIYQQEIKTEEDMRKLLEMTKKKAERVAEDEKVLINYLWKIYECDEELGNKLLGHLDNWENGDVDHMISTLITKIEAALSVDNDKKSV